MCLTFATMASSCSGGSRSALLRTSVTGMPACSAVTRKRVALAGSKGGCASENTMSAWSMLAIAGSDSELRRCSTSCTMPAAQ